MLKKSKGYHPQRCCQVEGSRIRALEEGTLLSLLYTLLIEYNYRRKDLFLLYDLTMPPLPHLLSRLK